MSKRGFAYMTAEGHRRVASIGGRKAHALGKAHRWTTEEARAAQAKGAATKRARREAAQS